MQAVHVAAKLGIADLVARGPKTVPELADATHTHGPSLGRLLRALTSLGIFGEDEPGQYSQSPLSDVLRTDHPESIRQWAMMLGAGFIWKPIGELAVTIGNGQPAFEQVYGAQFFRYLAEHPDDSAVFNAAMSSVPAYIAAIINGYLLIFDTVLTPSSDPAQTMMDVLMMVLTGGRERTESEFRSLLRDAGFSLVKVIPTMGASILETRPI